MYKIALVKLINYILWAMEHQKVTVIVTIALSVSFETVDHES